MYLLTKIGTTGYEAETSSAILEVTPPMLDWLSARVERVRSLAAEFRSDVTVTMAYPYPLDVYLAMPEAAEEAAMDGELDNGYMECSSDILDDITGEPEALDYRSVQISASFIHPDVRFLAVAFVFRLRHSDQEEYTYAISGPDLEAMRAHQAHQAPQAI